jgi:hypothetical protein
MEWAVGWAFLFKMGRTHRPAPLPVHFEPNCFSFPSSYSSSHSPVHLNRTVFSVLPPSPRQLNQQPWRDSHAPPSLQPHYHPPLFSSSAPPFDPAARMLFPSPPQARSLCSAPPPETRSRLRRPSRKVGAFVLSVLFISLVITILALISVISLEHFTDVISFISFFCLPQCHGYQPDPRDPAT